MARLKTELGLKEQNTPYVASIHYGRTLTLKEEPSQSVSEMGYGNIVAPGQ